MVAVDNELSAVDSRTLYRPHKTPANTHITTRAVDAVGILRSSFVSVEREGDMVFGPH
jgi:hypothetical protein